MADRKLNIVISGNAAQFQAAVKDVQASLAQVGKNVTQADKAMKQAQPTVRSFGSSLGRIGEIAGGFVLGSGILKGFDLLSAAIPGAISNASDLNESINKTGVVFGTMTDDVLAFSKGTAKALGISRGDTLEYASSLGYLFKAVGLTDEAMANNSKTLVQRAADIASLNNLDPTEVLEKMRSGLIGESEPLRSVGVLLTEELVAQEAVNSGLAKSTQGLTDAQKMQARYNLIMKQSAVAQGDFANTSTGLANASRITQATWKDLQVTMGTLFLPAVGKGMELLQRALGGVSDWVANNGPLLQIWSDNLSSGMSTAMDAVGAAIERVWPILQHLGPVLKDVVVANLQLLWSTAQTGVAIMERLANGIAAILGISTEDNSDNGFINLLDAIVYQFGEAQAAGEKLWAVLGPALNQLGAVISTYVLPIVGQLAEWFAAKLGPAVNTAMVEFYGFLDDIAPLIGPALQNIGNLIALLAQTWTDHWGTISGVLDGVWQVMEGVVTIAWSVISGIIKTGLALLAGDWNGAWNSIKEMLAGVWRGIELIIGGQLRIIGELVSLAWEGISNSLSAWWNGAQKSFQDMGSNIARAIGDTLGSVLSKFHFEVNWNQFSVPGLGQQFSIPSGVSLQYYAKGTTNYPGGWGIVGEQGAELVNLPGGSEIYNASQTRSMLGGSPIQVIIQAPVYGVNQLEDVVIRAVESAQRRGRMGLSGAGA